MNIVVTREAAADLHRLRAFLAETNLRAAQRAIAALSGAIQSLDVFPDRGRPSVRYSHTAQANEVVILRIWHGREARE